MTDKNLLTYSSELTRFYEKKSFITTCIFVIDKQ